MASDASDYPDHGIDPELKNEAWVLQYAKAAWHHSASAVKHMFAANHKQYTLNRAYALCKQPTALYIKPYLQEGSETDSYIPIDATPRAFISKYRDSMIAKCLQQEYRPTATPIDMTSVNSNNTALAEIKAKLAMRQALAQSGNPALAQHPALAMSPTDPQDLDEMEMQANFGQQFNRALDAEQVIALAFNENQVKMKIRKLWAQDFVDYGVGGFRDDLDANNRPILRAVNVKRFVPANACAQEDFSDLQGGGEVLAVTKISLLKHFSQSQIDNIPQGYGNCPNIGIFGNGVRDDKTADVWDFCFYSSNSNAWVKGTTKDGNPYLNKTDPTKPNDKAIKKEVQVVYQCKWVIGTDLIYDCGLLTNMKRKADPKKMGTTSLPFHFYAYNFDENKCQSYTERLIPLIDEGMHTVCKMQQFEHSMIPNGFSMDLSVVESTAMSQGGAAMTPKQQLAMYVQTGIAAWRSDAYDGKINNYQPFTKLENSNVNEIMGLWNHLNSTLGQIAAYTGFNEITDGSTPNAKTLVPGIESAQEGTNNALFPLYNAMMWLELSAAENLLLRAKQSIKLNGSYEGWVPAMNGTAMNFMSGDKELTLIDHGIMLDVMATDTQRNFIIQQMQTDIGLGLLDTSDVIVVLFTYNVKQVGMVLAFKVKRAKALQQQTAQANAQQTIQGQQQSAMMTAKGTADNLTLEYKLKGELSAQDHTQKMEEIGLQLKAGYDGKVEDNHAKIAAKHVEKDGKENVASINKGMPVQQDVPEQPAPMPPTAAPVDPSQESDTNAVPMK